MIDKAKSHESGIIDAIQYNLCRCSLLLGQTQYGLTCNDDDIKWVYTGTSALNRAFILEAGCKVSDERINSVLSTFKDKGVPVNWIMNDAVKSGGLYERIELLGMKYKNSWCGMALQLDGYISKPVQVPGYEVLKVENDEMLESWSGVLASSFSVPYGLRGDYIKVFSKLGFGSDKPWTYYIGVKDGIPVSCCMAYMEDGVSGFYWVGTCPEARKQGLASVIVSRAIDDAVIKRCYISILQASAAGKPVYEKLGFKEYCKFDIYSWTP